jgi:hypothetical protein
MMRTFDYIPKTTKKKKDNIFSSNKAKKLK